MAASTFEINGVKYEVPTLNTFDMVEAQILYDLSGLGLEDFFVDLDDEKQVEVAAHKTKNPAFRLVLLHVAYRRAHPDADRETIDQAVKGVNNMASLAAVLLSGEAEEDARPPDLSGTTSEPDASSKSEPGSSGTENVLSLETRGSGSTPSSDEQDADPATTGTGGSDTSSREWDREMSERSVRAIS